MPYLRDDENRVRATAVRQGVGGALFALGLHVTARSRQPSFHLFCALHAERAGIDNVGQRHATSLRFENFCHRVERPDESRKRFHVLRLHEVDFVNDDDLREQRVSGGVSVTRPWHQLVAEGGELMLRVHQQTPAGLSAGRPRFSRRRRRAASGAL